VRAPLAHLSLLFVTAFACACSAGGGDPELWKPAGKPAPAQSTTTSTTGGGGSGGGQGAGGGTTGPTGGH
jgi:hypothetical protein